MSNESSERIQKASRRLRLACTLAMAGLPVVVALVWVYMNSLPWMKSRLPAEVMGDIPSFSLWLGFLVTMIPTGVAIYGLDKLRRLFGLYERGLIFGQENVACFRGLGRTIIAWVIAEFLCDVLLSTIVTLHHPPGQRILAVGLSSNEVGGLFAGSWS